MAVVATKKFRLISDLHYEFCKTPDEQTAFWKVFDQWAESYPGTVDFLILAGDLCTVFNMYGLNTNYIELLKKIKNDYAHKWTHVIFVAGNHEFYTSFRQYDAVISTFHLIAKDTGCIYLDADVIEIDGIKIAGCTLWTDISATAMYTISEFSPENVFTTRSEYLIQHKKHVDFLADITQTERPDILITHHLPTFALIHERYHTEDNSAFASEIVGKLDLTTVKYVFSGHTHEYMSAKIGDTMFVVNPLGYPKEQSTRVTTLNNDVYEVLPQ